MIGNICPSRNLGIPSNKWELTEGDNGELNGKNGLRGKAGKGDKEITGIVMLFVYHFGAG